MRILSLNYYNYGSTGNIMLQINKLAKAQGNTVVNCYPKRKQSLIKDVDDKILIGSVPFRYLNELLGSYTGLNDCFSVFATVNFLRKVSKFKPDIIHFHNLHNCYINVFMLFRYIKKRNIKVVWTLHDCLPFTGHCPYFDIEGCDKWKTGCYSCPQYRGYPTSKVDTSKLMYGLKKKSFTGVNNLTIVTPSQWLAGLVKESYLNEYDVKVINNGINTDVFVHSPSDFKKVNGIDDKFMVLGVASTWNKSKNIDVFINLARELGDEYRIVLVGTNDELDATLPDNIISIHRTHNQSELAQIYTAADLFVNPTLEDNYPTVNMEALACGTPVLTYATGGSPEIIDESCGAVVKKNDYERLKAEIIRICTETPYSQEACLARARSFDMNDKFAEYIELYNEIMKQEV